jgi:integrase
MRRRGKGEGGITRRSDGRWQASYVGSDGRRHFLYGATRREAIEKLTAALRDKALGVYVAGPSQTVAQFLAAYLASRRSDLGPRTFERYAGQIRHATDAIGDVQLRRLTPQHLAQLYAELDLSSTSIAHLHSVLRGALGQALRWNLIARNPVAAVQPPRARRREMTVLAPAEIRALLEAVRGDEHEALYVLAVTAGLRQGELLGLRWRDVDLEAGWIDVNATLSRGQRLPPKNATSRRRVKIGQLARAALRSHRLRMAERLLPYRARTEGDTLVFVTPLGEPWYGSHITERSFKPLLRRAGLREVRFHDLRHACASLLLSQGVRVDLVSQMLGHSSPATTLAIYAHLMPGDQEEAARRMDGILGAQDVG